MLKIIVNSNLILELIQISLISSIISTSMIQKIKDTFNIKNIFIKIVSIIISFALGFFFSISFYSKDIINSIWIGIFSLIGAEKIYKEFNDYINKNYEKKD